MENKINKIRQQGLSLTEAMQEYQAELIEENIKILEAEIAQEQLEAENCEAI